MADIEPDLNKQSIQHDDILQHLEPIQDTLRLRYVSIKPNLLTNAEFLNYIYTACPQWELLDNDLFTDSNISDMIFRERIIRAIHGQYSTSKRTN